MFAEQLFDRHELPQDLSLYLHRPGATDPSMAPDQGDAFYVLAPVPNLQGNQDRLAGFLERHTN